ncbi:unnamed protein product [Lymnaea stagnalis]|uniref:Lysine-specific metallo-endopeptidase domain-containing protein n=1 Tax=Lymnaea stagnalis TaxID=6523 RepID=A0AAV2HDK7_LYMST
MLALVLLSLAAAATHCLPYPNGSNPHGFSTAPLTAADYEFLATLPRLKAGSQLPGFKYIYVEAGGHTTHTLDHARVQLEIAGSPRTSAAALSAAADYVIRMTRYMPAAIFQNVALKSTVGIFTAQEKLIVFPEYYSLANGNCGTSCTGSCAHTCTFDGRKYEDIAGVGGQRAVILDDNILCTAQDPYHHNLNILAHEYTHTIHQYGLDSATKQRVTSAYNSAKAAHKWNLQSYAMADEREYLAVGASVFFAVNRNGRENSGGMNICGVDYCLNELQARSHLNAVDSLLYGALAHIYTNDHGSLTSGLSFCPAGSVVG